MSIGKFRITRNNEYAYRYAKMKVRVNGESIGEIFRNETKEFEIPPGEYNIQVSQDFIKSRKMIVPIAAGQVVEFKVVIPDGESFKSVLLSSLLLKGLSGIELERVESSEGLRLFISESTEHALSLNSHDHLSVQHGRFSSYIQRETVIPDTGLSIFTNFTGLPFVGSPGAFILIGISFGTIFNSLIIGTDSEFLPVARYKYPILDRCFSVYESMAEKRPEPGQIWFGVDKDPNDGSEITLICAMYPVEETVIKDAEAIIEKLKEEPIRELTHAVIETGIEILAETSDPLDPISDTLAYKRQEFISDIKNPRKVYDVLISELMKEYGWSIVDSEIEGFLHEYQSQIITRIGVSAYKLLVKIQQNREEILDIAENVQLIHALSTSRES